MALVALLSNPRSTGNLSQLPAVRAFCASHPDIFHYEVEEVSQISRALETFARVKPRVLVINGGDGTVQAALTELYQGDYFDGPPPPVAVLPNGKTNLIAFNLGAGSNPIKALQSILDIAGGDMSDHIEQRELIALSDGGPDGRPTLGMFLAGAALAETILYCRNKIYPLGLPMGISHAIALFMLLLSQIFRISSSFLPGQTPPLSVSLIREDKIQGRFAILVVTTLEKLLLHVNPGGEANKGPLRLLAIDGKPGSVFRAFLSYARGRLGQNELRGVHLKQGDVIRIEGEASHIVLDGEMFRTGRDHPIELRSTPPVPFVKIAA